MIDPPRASSSNRIPILDLMRGVAVVFVFLFHVYGATFTQDALAWNGWVRDFAGPLPFLLLLPLGFGWTGVPVFFVVSGFCIHLTRIKQSGGGWRTFFGRRFFRIYPTYLIVLLVFAFWYPNTRVASGTPLDWLQLRNHLLLIHNLDPRTLFGINPAFWTIAVEVQLYLLYPALYFLARRWTWPRALMLAGGIECVVRLTKMADACWPGTTGLMPAWLSESPLTYWFSWGTGAWIAEAHSRGTPLPFARQPIWLWPLLCVTSYFFLPLSFFSFPFAAMSAAVILSRALAPRDEASPVRAAPGLWARHLVSVGVISYSFYLLHQPLVWSILPVAGWLGVRINPWWPVVLVGSLIAYIVIFGLAWVFHRWFEAPSARLGRRMGELKKIRPAFKTPT